MSTEKNDTISNRSNFDAVKEFAELKWELRQLKSKNPSDGVFKDFWVMAFIDGYFESYFKISAMMVHFVENSKIHNTIELDIIITKSQIEKIVSEIIE